jgi:hypothetical protein
MKDNTPVPYLQCLSKLPRPISLFLVSGREKHLVIIKPEVCILLQQHDSIKKYILKITLMA